MDDKLFAHIQRKVPPFNLALTRGLACKHLVGASDYIEAIMRCAELGFPPGLVYAGCSRVSPQESFNITTAKRSTKMMYELSRSDIFLMRYRFEYNGEALKPRYLFLPYVRPGGILSIMGSTFSISPVLADKSLSVGEDSIYIPMNRAKLTFKRHVVYYMADGRRMSQPVIWCNAHNGHKKPNPGSERKTITADAVLVHYLFCKYGLTETFAKFYKTHIVVGMPDMVNPVSYPSDQWIICESARVKPPGVNNKFWVASDIRIAVPRDKFSTEVATSVAGFFYIADRFPDRMDPSYCEDTSFWRILLGHIIHASNENEGKLLLNINRHIESLDGYVDNMVRQWLLEDKIPAEDIYELFFSMANTFSSRLMEAQQALASMFGKRLMVLRYVLIDIIKAIFNMMFALKEASKKNMTIKDIEKILHKSLKPLWIIKINHKHAEVTSVSSSGDCMAFKITSNLVLQADIGAGSNSKSTKLDATKVLHTSIAVAGQVNRLPKGEPTGRKNINPYVCLDAYDTIIPHADDVALMARTEFNIRR